MANAFETVKTIQRAIDSLPFTASVHAISVSHRAGCAIVTAKRDGGDFASWEWCEVNPGQLYWGHYDMTETEADSDHAQRFARLTGVAA